MDTFPLATNLRIPPQPPHVLRRTRLSDALERDVPRLKLVLLSAPAGYGKTTLLAQWAHTSPARAAPQSFGESQRKPVQR